MKRKIAGEEFNTEPRIDVIISFLQKEIDELEAYTKSLDFESEDPTEQLNELFRSTLEEVWSGDAS